MSQKAVTDFLTRVAQDAELRDRLCAASALDPAPAVAAIAAELGFDFTVEEVHQATEALRNCGEARLSELSDEDLAQVAGGFVRIKSAASAFPKGESLSGLSFLPEYLARKA